MERSETVGKLLEAIGAISQEIKPMLKKTKGVHGSKYVRLEEVQKELKPLLKSHEVTVCQPLVGNGITTVVSKGEEWMSFPTEIHNDSANPQQQMSGVTYMKRYSLIGLFNIITNDRDDDGEVASGFNDRVEEELEDIEL